MSLFLLPYGGSDEIADLFIRRATAQQRFSAILLWSLPVLVALGMFVMKPDYLRLLYTDPTGQLFLTYAICSEIVGILVILKIANPKF